MLTSLLFSYRNCHRGQLQGSEAMATGWGQIYQLPRAHTPRSLQTKTGIV